MRLKSGPVTYGAGVLRGKALAAFLFLGLPACAEPVTVLAFGDSLTQGYGLVEAEGFVPQLQAWLDAQGAEARIVNGGVSGSTTAGGAAAVGWAMTADVDAMIVALGGNDLLRGIDPEESRANLAEILDVADEAGVEVLLAGLIAPGNYGAEYKEAFEGMYPALAETYGTLLYPDFFAGLRAAEGARTDYFQPDGIHPNAAGVALIVEDIGPAVLELIAEAVDKAGDGT